MRPFTLLALVLGGCALGRPAAEEVALTPWISPARPFHAPGPLEGRADLLGAGPALYTVTATFTESEEILELAEAALLEEPDERDPKFVDEPERVGSLYVGAPPSFDIPMSEDPRVEEWIQYLTGRGREWTVKWMARSTRYIPLFWPILERHGVPKDLVFLSMIESGFSPRAYSWAHAAGPWQFVPGTAKMYGLEVGFWVDDRRDFERATDAAARHLSDLYAQFGDWYLAWAAYNAGPGKIRRAVRGYGSSDFWKLSRFWWLRKETRHYVPKLLAAAKVTKEPERYGFADVEYLPELSWDVLTVTVAVDLGTVAAACGDPDDERLKLLNPALRTGVTPPGRRYDLRVPSGHLERCRSGLAARPVAERFTFRYHELKPGDSLASLAKRYRTTPDAILRFAGVTEDRLHDFDELVVPVPLLVADQIPIVEPRPNRVRGSAYGPDGMSLVQHTVQPGDSLWRIARKYRVNVRKLKLWNGLWKDGRLRVGQVIKVYVGQGGAPSGRRGR